MKDAHTTFGSRHTRPLWLVVAGLACTAPSAWAEAPMHTDDAGALEPGTYKVESVLRRDHRARGADLALGVGAAPGLELGVSLSRDRDTAATPATTSRGQGLSVKWVPLRDEAGWSLGARLDLGHARVRDGATDTRYSERGDALTALATYRLARGQVLHLNAGHRSAKAQGVRQRAMTWAAGYELPLAEKLQLTTEIYGEEHARPDKALGVRYAIADGLKISAAAGRGNGRTFAQAGVAWEF